jgi:cobalt/nickel transport system permease protein
MEEALRMVRARDMRSFGQRGIDARTVVRLLGSLFLRTVDRSERVYHAMLSRGFRGDIPSLKQSHFAGSDALFLVGTIAMLALFRFNHVPAMLGRFVQELFL